MPFVILHAFSTRVATWKSALTALYSHRPQPTFFNPLLLRNWDAFRMRWPINERHELTFLPGIRKLGVIASLLQRVSNYHRTSTVPSSQPSLLLLAKRPKWRGKKARRHDCFWRLIPSTPFGEITFTVSTVKLRTSVNKLNLFSKETFATFWYLHMSVMWKTFSS